MNWLRQNWWHLLELLGDHLILTLPAIALSLVISIPIGRFAFTRPRIGGITLSSATLLYAIPGLPMLILIPAIFNIPLRSNANMIIALTLYGIALLVRSVVDGYRSVDGVIRDTGIALGHSKRSVFWNIDMPLAMPVIIAGLRVVAVSTVSLVTVGALVGISGLGALLTDGFQRGLFSEVLIGIIATMLLALALDGLLLLLGRALTPWEKSVRAREAS